MISACSVNQSAAEKLLNGTALFIGCRQPVLLHTTTFLRLHKHRIMRTLLSPLLLTACQWLTECHHFGHPRVQLGDTTLIGKDFQPSKLEFFGGYSSHHFYPTSSSPLPSHHSGIPFAEPPVDDLRFSPPRPKYSLSPLRSFDARDFGPPCLQPAVSPLTGTPVSAPPESFANMSEDCLNLNVFRPSGVDATSSLPVMVWIFGGAFQCA